MCPSDSNEAGDHSDDGTKQQSTRDGNRSHTPTLFRGTRPRRDAIMRVFLTPANTRPESPKAVPIGKYRDIVKPRTTVATKRATVTIRTCRYIAHG